MRFDFELAPGADPGRIRLDFTGADDLAIEKNGDLAVTVAGRRGHVRKPAVFQETAAGRRSVEGGFVADGPRAVRVALAGCDHTLPLVIDPTIDFASYLGTGGDEEVHWAETRGGSVYVSGRTWSTAFPKVPAALRFFLSGGQWGVSVFTEPAPGGTWVGANFPVPELQPDRPVRIKADNAGNTYLAGSCNAGAPTEDVEEPVTAGSSGLQYDATAGIYTCVWKTTTSMAGGCWRLSLRLTDGTQRYTLFSVKK